MKIAFLFYQGMTALDVIGPHEVLSRLPNADVYTVAKAPGLMETTKGIRMLAEHSIKDVEHVDVLCVPGAGNATSLKDNPDLLNWLAMMHQHTTWTTSVCTGSLILGAAGLLKGVKATSHWATMESLIKWGALPTNDRVVESGKIITAAGVSAGIDMALTLAAKLTDTPTAEALQLGLEYDPTPPFDSGSVEKASPALVTKVRAMLNARFEA